MLMSRRLEEAEVRGGSHPIGIPNANTFAGTRDRMPDLSLRATEDRGLSLLRLRCLKIIIPFWKGVEELLS